MENPTNTTTSSSSTNDNTTSSSSRIIYGQVVVGPPGAGKTTYCNGMQQYLQLLQRNAWIINMDPANDTLSQQEEQQQNNILFDVRYDMIDLTQVMETMNLGPNGGLLYCMEYMATHVHEIVQQIQDKQQEIYNNNNNNNNNQEPLYLLLDFPGQVELYTHSTCVQQLIQQLQQQLNLRCTLVQCIDSQYCYQASSFLSAVLLGTTTLLRMELPAITVWTKMDLLRGNDLPMPWEFFMECYDLERILPFLDPSSSYHQYRKQHKQDKNNSTTTTNDDNDLYDYEEEEDDDDIWDDPDYTKARQKRKQSKWFQKYTQLYAHMAEIVQDFGLLMCLPLDIQDATMVGRVLAKIDQCNGYVWTKQLSSSTSSSSDLFQYAATTTSSSDYTTGETRLEIRERIQQSSSTITMNTQQT